MVRPATAPIPLCAFCASLRLEFPEKIWLARFTQRCPRFAWLSLSGEDPDLDYEHAHEHDASP
jgi:hypothetical protein